MTIIPEGYRRCIGPCNQKKALNANNYQKTSTGYWAKCRDCSNVWRREQYRNRVMNGEQSSRCYSCKNEKLCRKRIALALNVICETRTKADLVRAQLRAEGFV